jgi:hypothetical protein
MSSGTNFESLLSTNVLSSNAAEGVPFRYISHSYGNVQSFTNCSAGALGCIRIEKRLRPSSFTKNSYNGYTSQEVASEILGTGAPWTAGERGLVIVDCTQNDMRVHGTSAQGIKGYENSLRSLFYLLMAKERIAFSTFSFTSGTWGENTQAQLPGGKNKSSTSTSAQYTIPFTGTACAVLLTGRNNTGGINTPIGGIAKIEVDGVVKAEVSLENACLTGTELSLVFCPVVVPLLGLSNTAHTIKVTNVGAAGTVMYAEQLLNLSETLPPTVFIMKQLYLPEYVEEGSKAAVTLYNEALEKVVNELVAGGYPVQAIETNAGLPPESERSSYIKQRHPNDKCFAVYANNAIAEINKLAYRQGLNVL